MRDLNMMDVKAVSGGLYYLDDQQESGAQQEFKESDGGGGGGLPACNGGNHPGNSCVLPSGNTITSGRLDGQINIDWVGVGLDLAVIGLSAFGAVAAGPASGLAFAGASGAKALDSLREARK